MNNNNIQNYFTAGELASMFDISKQTLLYYDKVGLLVPEFVSNNGYRHYSMNQYLILEIIVCLRKLNISVNNIKKFITERNNTVLQTILINKEKECAAIIAENERILKALQIISTNLNSNYDKLLDKITLSFCPKELIRVTAIDKSFSGKDRIMLFSKHSLKIFHAMHIKKKEIGWIIDKNNFLTSNQNLEAKAFFSYAADIQGHKKVEKFILIEGFYVELYIKGTFYENAKKISQNLMTFLKNNNLKAISDIYILPIKNHWFTKNSHEYITKIFLQVEYL